MYNRAVVTSHRHKALAHRLPERRPFVFSQFISLVNKVSPLQVQLPPRTPFPFPSQCLTPTALLIAVYTASLCTPSPPPSHFLSSISSPLPRHL